MVSNISNVNFNTTDNGSIIDWGFAAFVPIVTAAGLPRFLWPDLDPSATERPAALQDRLAYIRSFSSQTSQASQASSLMWLWQKPNDVVFRTLYLASISSKGIHTRMAQLGWKLPREFLVEEEEHSLGVNTQRVM
jgi:hypothetical protein